MRNTSALFMTTLKKARARRGAESRACVRACACVRASVRVRVRIYACDSGYALLTFWMALKSDLNQRFRKPSAQARGVRLKATGLG